MEHYESFEKLVKDHQYLSRFYPPVSTLRSNEYILLLYSKDDQFPYAHSIKRYKESDNVYHEDLAFHIKSLKRRYRHTEKLIRLLYGDETKDKQKDIQLAYSIFEEFVRNRRLSFNMTFNRNNPSNEEVSYATRYLLYSSRFLILDILGKPLEENHHLFVSYVDTKWMIGSFEKSKGV